MLFAPVPGEVLGDLFGRLRTARVAVRRERDGIAFARDDGPDDGHPGRPREVADRAMHLDVHLVQGLLHPLDTPRALGHEIGDLALPGSQPRDGLAGADGAAEQAAAMEELKPLTITEIGLAARQVVKLS